MSDEGTPIIAVRENAFIRAANIPRITDTDGTTLEAKPVSALCRCGLSANKPYCDGSHKREGFDGSPPAESGSDRVNSYEGAEVTIHYTRLLCSHAAECGKRLPSVFNTAQRPWIQPDNGTVDELKAIVEACPSGALRYSLNGGEPHHIVSDEVGIAVEKNGPYRVTGIPLEEFTPGLHGTANKYVLCRCGLSKNKPYCDGTHKDEGWSDS